MSTSGISPRARSRLTFLCVAAIGSTIGVASVAYAIWLAYYQVHTYGLAGRSVTIVGLHLYEVARHGSTVIGHADGAHIAFVPLTSAVLALGILAVLRHGIRP